MKATTRNNPVSGASYFFRGLSLIGQKGLKRYVAIPLLINVLIFVTAISLATVQLPILIGWVAQMLPAWLFWLSWLLIPLFVIVAALTVLLSFTVIGNLVAAPFNSRLAEMVEERLTGKKPEARGVRYGMVQEVVGGIYSEIRKLTYFVLRAIPLLILLMIPGLNLVAPILWLLFSSWMLALEYLDYPMANHGLSFQRQRQVMREKRALALGYGGMLTIVLLIPFLNLFLIPAGVAGATVMWVEQLSLVAEPGAEKSPVG